MDVRILQDITKKKSVNFHIRNNVQKLWTGKRAIQLILNVVIVVVVVVIYRNMGIMQIEQVCPICNGSGGTLLNQCKVCNQNGLVDSKVHTNVKLMYQSDRIRS